MAALRRLRSVQCGRDARFDRKIEVRPGTIGVSWSTKEQDTTEMSEIIFIIEEDPEGGFIARALGHSIFTEADSLADLHEQVRDAVRCHFEEEELPFIWE
jgi:hypothetical protein